MVGLALGALVVYGCVSAYVNDKHTTGGNYRVFVPIIEPFEVLLHPLRKEQLKENVSTSRDSRTRLYHLNQS